MTSEVRFRFGENWASFSRHLTETQLAEARASLQRLLDMESLEDHTFLDIGCGSGLFSIAAAQLGARQVVGIDIDPVSVRTSQDNARRWAPDAPLTFRQVSVLDETAMEALDTFDIVYSWGVLHHTGDMRRALRIAAARVRTGGLFVVAIYNRHWSSPFVKRGYNLLPVWGQRGLAGGFAPVILLAKALVTRRNPFKVRRGMDFFHNLVDWLGGILMNMPVSQRCESYWETWGFMCCASCRPPCQPVATSLCVGKKGRTSLAKREQGDHGLSRSVAKKTFLVFSHRALDAVARPALLAF